MVDLYDPDAETSPVRLYLDESDDNATAVVGGILINKSYFPHFEESWEELLDDFNIRSPLHMREFGRPHGLFAQITDCCRRKLFERVAHLVNFHKLFSLDARIGRENYERYVSRVVKKRFSLYGLCFVSAVAMNKKLAEVNGYTREISLILDSGNSKTSHVVAAHGEIAKIQNAGEFMNLGPLKFSNDKSIGCLQAADVIAWGARRKAKGMFFSNGFEPIAKMLGENELHFSNPWQAGWLRELGRRLELRIRDAQTEDPQIGIS